MTHPIKSSIPPQLPPTTEEDVISHLRLLRSRRVGPATYRRMLAEYGTAADALQALPDVARAAGVDDYAICPIGVIRAELQAAKAAGARLLWDTMTHFILQPCAIYLMRLHFYGVWGRPSY